MERLSTPELALGEVLVRVRLCTLCGSDLHTFTGRRHGPTPCVLGHEMVGEIAELNGEKRDAAGEPLAVGDRVTWAVADHCGACFYCTHDLPQKCERLKKYGHHAHDTGRGPSGGLATHCQLWPGTAVVKVPAAVSDEAAAPAMCATATVAGALRLAGVFRSDDNPHEGDILPTSPRWGEVGEPKVSRVRGWQEQRTPHPAASQPTSPQRGEVGRAGTPVTTDFAPVVLILGAGMLGLTASALAASAGGTVIVADTNVQRLETARRFGATATATPGELPATLAELTSGRGADAVLELAGVTTSVETALASVRVGGTVVLVGSVFPVAAVAVNPESVVRKCLRIVGSHNYVPADLVAAIRFLGGAGAAFPFGELVGRTLSLDDVNEAFRAAEAEKPYRLGVRP